MVINMKWFSCVALLVLVATVYGRDPETPNLLTDLGPDSPWIVSRHSVHVRGEENHAKFKGTPFTMRRDAQDGQTEYRVFHNNILGLETVVKRLGESSLYFREVTDGKKVLKLIYAGRRGLVDCDVQRNLLTVDEFVAEFMKGDPSHVGHLRHIQEAIDMSTIYGDRELFGKTATFHIIEKDVISEPYATILDMKTLLGECRRIHHHMRHMLRAAGVNLDQYKHVLTPEDREVSKEFIPRRVKRTKRGTSKSRSKRSLLIPDTKWCGAGSSNDNFEDVGHSRSTDRCCREHDHCPYYIEGFSKNYNLFNARFYTISHCYCDEMFRTCLKTASTDQSLMVGRVYFNVLGMKCFEFDEEEVCTERAWWGGCQKSEVQIVAQVRGSLSWS